MRKICVLSVILFLSVVNATAKEIEPITKYRFDSSGIEANIGSTSFSIPFREQKGFAQDVTGASYLVGSSEDRDRQDGLISKLDVTGEFAWSLTITNENATRIELITVDVDASGNVYFAGVSVNDGEEQWIVGKVIETNGEGELVWLETLSPPGNSVGDNFPVQLRLYEPSNDPSEVEVFVAGVMNDFIYSEITVAKFDSDGNQPWSSNFTYSGSDATFDDGVLDLLINENGDPVVMGLVRNDDVTSVIISIDDSQNLDQPSGFLVNDSFFVDTDRVTLQSIAADAATDSIFGLGTISGGKSAIFRYGYDLEPLEDSEATQWLVTTPQTVSQEFPSKLEVLSDTFIAILGVGYNAAADATTLYIQLVESTIDGTEIVSQQRIFVDGTPDTNGNDQFISSQLIGDTVYVALSAFVEGETISSIATLDFSVLPPVQPEDVIAWVHPLSFNNQIFTPVGFYEQGQSICFLGETIISSENFISHNCAERVSETNLIDDVEVTTYSLDVTEASPFGIPAENNPGPVTNDFDWGFLNREALKLDAQGNAIITGRAINQGPTDMLIGKSSSSGELWADSNLFGDPAVTELGIEPLVVGNDYYFVIQNGGSFGLVKVTDTNNVVERTFFPNINSAFQLPTNAIVYGEHIIVTGINSNDFFIAIYDTNETRNPNNEFVFGDYDGFYNDSDVALELEVVEKGAETRLVVGSISNINQSVGHDLQLSVFSLDSLGVAPTLIWETGFSSDRSFDSTVIGIHAVADTGVIRVVTNTRDSATIFGDIVVFSYDAMTSSPDTPIRRSILPSGGKEEAFDTFIDEVGNLFIGGSATSNSFASEQENIFLVKLNASLNTVSTYFVSNGINRTQEIIRSIDVIGDRLYATGTLQLVEDGPTKMFMGAFDMSTTASTLLWFERPTEDIPRDGIGEEIGVSIKADDSGNVWGLGQSTFLDSPVSTVLYLAAASGPSITITEIDGVAVTSTAQVVKTLNSVDETTSQSTVSFELIDEDGLGVSQINITACDGELVGELNDLDIDNCSKTVLTESDLGTSNIGPDTGGVYTFTIEPVQFNSQIANADTSVRLATVIVEALDGASNSSRSSIDYKVQWDTDGDGILNQDDSDDDNDGLDDDFELANGLDPNVANPDVDGDGVSNADELLNGTNPLDADTDGDGKLDNVDEDPLVYVDCPGPLCSIVTSGWFLKAVLDSQYDGPIITAVNGQAVTISENPETVAISINEGTASLAISVQNRDGDALFYTLNSGQTSDFTISNTGVLNFNDVPDYDSGDRSYTIGIRVTDASGLADIIVLNISITNVDEAPEFTTANVLTVSEFVSVPVAIQIAANDPESGDLDFSAPLGGADTGAFSITMEGLLSFNQDPDFESPNSAAGTNVYSIDLTVADDENSVTETFTIEVLDANESPEALVDVATVFQPTVTEDQTSKFSVLGFFADTDGTPIEDTQTIGVTTSSARALALKLYDGSNNDVTETGLTTSEGGTVTVGISFFGEPRLIYTPAPDFNSGAMILAPVLDVVEFWVEDYGVSGDEAPIRLQGSFSVLVEPENDSPTGAVVIVGTLLTGQTLMADTAAVADVDGMPSTLNYQWKRDGSNVSGATNASYTIVGDDVGTLLGVDVSFLDDFSTLETLAASADTIVSS